MFQSVKRSVAEYNLLQEGDRVVVGVSGGPDSVVLLHILLRLKEEYRLSLHVAHLNHQFRGRQADDDALFVRELCRAWAVDFTDKTVDVPKLSRDKGLSAEEAGRMARYDFFEELAVTTKSNKIAVAHHRDDQAETVLINLLRGSGVEGLSGMRPIREQRLIRPLLFVSREEIEMYCHENNLKSRLDESNLQADYRRNKIRLELIPQIEQTYNPQFRRTLSRTAEILGDEDDYMQTIIEKISKQHVVIEGSAYSISLQNLLKQPKAIRRRLIRSLIAFAQGTTKGLSFDHIEQIMVMVEKGTTGKHLRLPGGLVARIEYGVLTVDIHREKHQLLEGTRRIQIPGVTDIPELGYRFQSYYESDNPATESNHVHTLCLDRESIITPLYIRTRKKGDRMLLPAGQGHVKIKELMIDKKIPQGQRDRIPILTDADDRILWVVGVKESGLARYNKDSKAGLIRIFADTYA